MIDVDDWQISHRFFSYLESIWGLHTVDCFASFYNFKVAKFFSCYWNPGCAGVDFFVQSLEGENCLVVPPVCLIARAIHYLFHHKAVATLIVSFWPSSHFWPIISRKFFEFIIQITSSLQVKKFWSMVETRTLYLDQKGFMVIYWLLDWILVNPENNLSINSTSIS